MIVSGYPAIFERSMDAVFVSAPDGSILAANPAACRLFGRTEMELCDIGRSGVVDSSSSELSGFLDEHQHTGNAWAELLFIRGDGVRFPGEVSSLQFIDDQGQERTILIIRDITERKLVEEALVKSEGRFRTLTDRAPIAISISRHAQTIYVNQKFLELYGFDRAEEILGGSIGVHWSGESRPAIEERAHQRSLGLPVPTNFEGTGVRKDGSLFACHVAAAVVDLPDGPASIGFLTDITERKQAEAQLLEAQKMQAIGHLAGGIAHDFNNLLGAIRGFASFLGQDLPSDSSGHQYAQRILNACQRGTSIVDQILAFARTKETPKRPIDLTSVVTDCVDTLRGLMPNSVTFDVAIDSRRLPVIGNDGQIAQILINLCTNANTALDGKTGVVSLRVSHNPGKDFALCPSLGLGDDVRGANRLVIGTLDPERHYACIEVTDSGRGIPDDVLPRIFEPFFTGDQRRIGTGLGLAVVHRIAADHGGLLQVDSAVGRGTRFSVCLPLDGASELQTAVPI